MILGIYGSGGAGREILALSEYINNMSNRWESIVFLDDIREEKIFRGLNVITFDNMKDLYTASQIQLCIAIGEPFYRDMLLNKVTENGYKVTSIIHPSIKIPSSILVGEGTIMCEGVTLTCDIKVGKNVLIQSNAHISHDCVIGSSSVIGHSVSIAGGCTIGERTYIGMNVPVREFTVVGNDAIVGMGAVVLKDIPDGAVAYGNPAQVIKKNEDTKFLRRFQT